MRARVRISIPLAAVLCFLPAGASETAKAVFAGGCFWCMEAPFDAIPGVVSTVSGYTGGEKNDPTYKEVSAGTTGHYEALEVTYDPATVRYEKLLEVFWRNVDPFDATGQFCDKGPQYRSAIFVRGEREKAAAEASKRAVESRLGKSVATRIVEASRFWPAEDYHQDYYRKNPVRYRFYRYNCGRDERLAEVWRAATGGGH